MVTEAYVGPCRRVSVVTVSVVTAAWILVLLGFASTNGVQQTSNPRIVEHPEDQYVVRNEPATLNCKAEGEPPPVIAWYRRGQPVVTSNENPFSHRMLLPSGQLFFLKIIHNGKNQTDVGVYYCNATNPETLVSAVSRNATLDIATIRDDFREQPRNTEVAVGGEVVLPCRPPRGRPDPHVRWKKDSEPVKTGDRVVLEESGALRLRDARKDDAGIYVCVAYNVGGERDSVPARLAVRERPRIIEGPKDATVQENSDVLFRCRTNGDPELTIIWKKVDGQIPPGRSRILDDRSLKIEKVDVNDEGIYICRVENSVGSQESEARLSVHSQPSFVITPQDKVVGVGRQATFRCQVTGNPVPAVFWSKEQNLMFPNYDSGRFSVLEDGTLIVESVRPEDAGEYTCKGLSIAGSAYAKARLDVRDLDPRPPPIIQQGPQNQTLPISSIAMLQCSSSGEPAPVVRWFKNNRELTMRDPRFALLDSGTLQISDLRKSDTGMYTCRASSDTGESSSWSAALVVETPLNTAVIFHRTPEPSTFPGPPSRPVVQEVTDTSVRLAWKANSNHGSSPVQAYTVEYFSHETGEGWIIATDSVRETTYTIKNLRADTSYLFLVRSQNSHGLSMPSPVTTFIRTKDGADAWDSVPQVDPALVSEKLGQQLVTVLQPEVLNSTAVKVVWEVRRNQRFIEGFHVKYRMLLEPEDQPIQSANPPHGHHSDFTVETVQSAFTAQYVLNRLAKYTWYEIQVQPFQGTVEGQDSNTIRVRTFEDVPSAPPDKIRWRMIDNSTMHLSWEAPSKSQRNGPLRGYKIYLYGNESRFDREVLTNSSSDFIIIPHLVKDMAYRIQLSAYNRIGEGVRSDILTAGPPPQSSGVELGVVHQPWFIATLILTIGGALWFALCVFSVWLYRRRRNGKTQKNGAISGKLENMGSFQGYPVKSSYKVVPSAPQPDVTCQAMDVAADGYSTKASENSSDYYNCRGGGTTTAPYARAAVPVGGGGGGGGGGGSPFLRPKNEGAFRPVQSYVIQKPFEDEGAVRNVLKDGPSRCNAVDQRGFMTSPMSDSDDTAGYGHNHSGSIHPMLFLPPPPAHPPPSDTGSPPDSPVLRHYGPPTTSCSGLPRLHSTDQDSGGFAPRQLYHHDRSGGNDMSRSFAPRSQNQSNAGLVARCPSSPKQGTASPRPYHGPNPYSPRAFSDPEYGPRGAPPARQSYEPVVAEERDLRLPFGDPEGVVMAPRRGQVCVPPSPASDDPMTDRSIQSSLPSLVGGECITPLPRPELYISRGDSPISEIGAYPGLESDMETNAPRDCHSPVSSVDEMERAVADSVLASWTNAIEDSDTNCSSVRSSAVSSSDGSFFAEADFASAVARAAELSGLTVIGSTIIDPNGSKDREKIKKPAKHRQRAQRPTSPYSTDSNYSAIQIPHKPYPKSERKKQLTDQGARYKPSNDPLGKGQSCHMGQRPLPALPSKQQVHDKPSSSNIDATSKNLKPQDDATSRDLSRMMSLRANPLDAFDMRDTPIV